MNKVEYPCRHGAQVFCCTCRQDVYHTRELRWSWVTTPFEGGYLVSGTFNDMPPTAPRYFDTEEQVDMHIAYERTMLRAIVNDFAERKVYAPAGTGPNFTVSGVGGAGG